MARTCHMLATHERAIFPPVRVKLRCHSLPAGWPTINGAPGASKRRSSLHDVSLPEPPSQRRELLQTELSRVPPRLAAESRGELWRQTVHPRARRGASSGREGESPFRRWPGLEPAVPARGSCRAGRFGTGCVNRSRRGAAPAAKTAQSTPGTSLARAHEAGNPRKPTNGRRSHPERCRQQARS